MKPKNSPVKPTSSIPPILAWTDTLGWILYRQGNYRDALRLLEESAARARGHPEIQYHLGMARVMMGRHDDAAPRSRPPSPHSWISSAKMKLASSWRLLQDRDSALEQMTWSS